MLFEFLESERTFDIDFIPLCEFSWNDLDWSAHDWVELLIGVYDGLKRVVEDPKRESQVDSHVLEDLGLLAEQELDDLDTDGTDDHGSGGGNGGDDLSGDELHLEVVDFLDLVVAGSKVANSGHELDMEIAGIVFFELNTLRGFVCIDRESL